MEARGRSSEMLVFCNADEIAQMPKLAGTTKTAQELYDQMLALYPTRVNPGWALWSSARAAKP